MRVVSIGHTGGGNDGHDLYLALRDVKDLEIAV
jgi:hypothetical protein